MSEENAVATVPTETGIMPADIVALQQAAGFGEDFGKISGTRISFLPRLQLFTSNSEHVKKGKINIAHYGIIKGKTEELIDCGKTVLVSVVSWRPKAMFVKSDPPLAYHKVNSQEFQDVKAKADADSNSGNMYGPEYLMWHPEHGFCTFFMGSKTARNEAPAVQALLPTKENGGRLRVGMLSAQFIETSEYSWHGPVMTLSAQSITMPSSEELSTVVGNFLNPQDSKKETATAEEAAAAGTVPDR